jgi:nitrogen regulatory protein P-II 2
MRTVPVVCLTIVAEAVVEARLLRDLEAAGVRGWTLTSGRGRGTSRLDASDWEGPNVRLETLLSSAAADRVLTMLAELYFPHFAVVAWVTPAQVVRGDRFL